MAEIKHPMRIEMDKISTLIHELQQLYTMYFQGMEKSAPHKKRKDLEEKMTWIRTEVTKKNNAALNFYIRQLDARYHLMKNRWDKTLSEIESGEYLIPKKPMRK